MKQGKQEECETAYSADKGEQKYEITHSPETSDARQFPESPEILPRLDEGNIPEKQPARDKPYPEIGRVIDEIAEEEQKEKKRREKIKEIIEKRDNPKKRIH